MLIRKIQQPSDYPSNSIHDAYNDSATDTYSCNYINNVTTSEYFIATINTAKTLTAAEQATLNFSTSSSSSDNYFYTSAVGNIVSKKACKIRISAVVFVEGAVAGSYIWTRITKNGNIISGGLATANQYGGYVSSIVPATIIDIASSDVFNVLIDPPGGGTVRAGSANTWLLIEVIG